MGGYPPHQAQIDYGRGEPGMYTDQMRHREMSKVKPGDNAKSGVRYNNEEQEEDESDGNQDESKNDLSNGEVQSSVDGDTKNKKKSKRKDRKDERRDNTKKQMSKRTRKSDPSNGVPVSGSNFDSHLPNEDILNPNLNQMDQDLQARKPDNPLSYQYPNQVDPRLQMQGGMDPQQQAELMQKQKMMMQQQMQSRQQGDNGPYNLGSSSQMKQMNGMQL
jgi:hypothetical protein